MPAEGDCLTGKDAATVVKCSEPHAYEVFYAKADPTHAGDKKKRKAWENATCVTQGAAFLGNAGFPLSRLYAEPMESPGAGRVACIAYEYRTTLGGIASNTSTLKGRLKGNGFYDYNLCLKGRASKDKIELVPCSQPHASEVIGGKLQGKPGDPFPKGGDKTIHAEARKYCKPLR